VFLGVETLAKPSLGRMHKGTRNEDAELERIFLNLRENGINSTVSLIVGKYTGGIENFRHTLERLDALGASDFPDQKISDPNEMIGGSKRKIKVGKKTFVLIVPL
jgi:tyrosyl-tRNA synthetase